ncbi:unnamed protein product [Prunus armeniaca]|uniref:Uncharacterized protein n=1 Tax=Prunus armeniaca TaxID=36596 RepID=A0A6J5WVB0_PRUAR|nr:unnamed protein product [Prunus armeniaca]
MARKLPSVSHKRNSSRSQSFGKYLSKLILTGHILNTGYPCRKGNWWLVPLPPNRYVAVYKRVYRVKYNADGSVPRCKASLVTRISRRGLELAFNRMNQGWRPYITLCTRKNGVTDVGFEAEKGSLENRHVT